MTSMKNQTFGNKSYCLYEEINVWHLCPDLSAKPPDHMGEATFSIRFTFSTLQMFAGIYGGFIGKSECGDFKFMGIACNP